jgi:hypothetical protein
MSDTTSIMDLPTDPANGGNITNNNMTIRASENVQIPAMPMPQQIQMPSANTQMSLDQSTINMIVSGLQQASTTGATQLPSRDIPMTTNNIMQDAQTQPNYVPQPTQGMRMNYIDDYERTEEMMQNYAKNSRRGDSLDEMYNEIQIPLLIGVLYFLFQLPVFRKYLLQFFPVLFSMDGNLNINGYIFTSILFGLFYYILNKTTYHFGMF